MWVCTYVQYVSMAVMRQTSCMCVCVCPSSLWKSAQCIHSHINSRITPPADLTRITFQPQLDIVNTILCHITNTKSWQLHTHTVDGWMSFAVPPVRGRLMFDDARAYRPDGCTLFVRSTMAWTMSSHPINANQVFSDSLQAQNLVFLRPARA